MCFIDTEFHQEAFYLQEWHMQTDGMTYFYYRRHIGDEWISLDSIQTELESDSSLLGYAYDPAVDTLDPNGDGYVLGFQIKLVNEPIVEEVVLDPFPCDSVPTELYQYVEISTFINGSAMGVFPNATDSLDVYEYPKTNQDNRDTYFTYYDGPKKLSITRTKPKVCCHGSTSGDCSQTDTLSWIGNYFIRDYTWVDSISLDEWDFDIINVDASTEDP